MGAFCGKQRVHVDTQPEDDADFVWKHEEASMSPSSKPQKSVSAPFVLKPTSEVTEAHWSTWNPRRTTILVVDDDLQARKALEKWLSFANFTVLFASDADEAINLLTTPPPPEPTSSAPPADSNPTEAAAQLLLSRFHRICRVDVVLADVHAASEILDFVRQSPISAFSARLKNQKHISASDLERQLQDFALLPIVMMSSEPAEAAAIDRRFRRGFNDYLHKPVSKTVLLNTIAIRAEIFFLQVCH